jgi:hypothetical protein
MARLDDGFSTTISLTGANTTFWEKSVTPPGLDGGGSIDTTTMRNTAWRTFAPKSLVTMSEMSLTVAYDSSKVADITDLNVNQQIVVTFPDASTLTFWGFVNTFAPGELAEGEQPEAEITIIPTNRDNASPPVEVAPVVA